MLTINPDLLAKIANDLKELLISTIQENRQVATGRTIASIRSESGDNYVEVFGPRHIKALQEGRKPTENSGPGDLYPKILEWVRAKGVIFQDGIQNSKYTIEERTAKTITYFIHKRGTYLFQRGQTFNGVSNPILRNFTPELVSSIRDQVVGDVRLNVSSEVFSILKELSK
jgi:hypothetical protein